ncbi:hypothetical protein BBJ28_00023465 [Nothophytophthora sp. Chile5]|nr:hypothetical protein BBJ28_00023465 [Nothophytophthora sp. Chile5]
MSRSSRCLPANRSTICTLTDPFGFWLLEATIHTVHPVVKSDAFICLQRPRRSKLYQKHCIKDEQRSAHRISQQHEKARSAREARATGSNSGRQPLDPEHTLSRKLTAPPDAIYDTDCGSKKTLHHHVEDGSNTCRGAFSSTKDRFASTAAYRSSTFASVVKEPYADPQAVGPGTYRAPRRAMSVKKQQVPTPTYVSKAARFEEASAQVTAVLALASPLTNAPPESFQLGSPRNAGGGGRASPDKEAAMVHNTPNFPILASATQDTVGPGAYSPTAKARPPEDANFIMMPQHVRGFLDDETLTEAAQDRILTSIQIEKRSKASMDKLWKTGPTAVFKTLKPIVHWGFVPLVIFIALKQEPDLSLMQIFNPFSAPPEPPQLQ